MVWRKTAELWLAIAVDAKHKQEVIDRQLLMINIARGNCQPVRRTSVKLL